MLLLFQVKCVLYHVKLPHVSFEGLLIVSGRRLIQSAPTRKYRALLNLAFCPRKVSRSWNAVCGNILARGEVDERGAHRLALTKFKNEILYSFGSFGYLVLKSIGCRCNGGSNDSIEGMKSKIATWSQLKICWWICSILSSGHNWLVRIRNTCKSELSFNERDLFFSKLITLSLDIRNSLLQKSSLRVSLSL
jgi:hypothetical protein